MRAPGAKRSEAEVLRAVGEYLATRGDVVASRMNTGAATIRDPKTGKARFMRFGFKGCPDYLGYKVRLGRVSEAPELWRVPVFLAIECKKEGGLVGFPHDARERAQSAFLDRVRADGGIGILADDVATVARGLEGTHE